MTAALSLPVARRPGLVRLVHQELPLAAHHEDVARGGGTCDPLRAEHATEGRPVVGYGWPEWWCE